MTHVESRMKETPIPPSSIITLGYLCVHIYWEKKFRGYPLSLESKSSYDNFKMECTSIFSDESALGQIEPNQWFLFTGENFRLSCYSLTRTVWIMHNRRIPKKYLDSNGNLHVNSANQSFEGRYFCEGTKQGNVKFKTHADVYIAGRY